VAGFVRGHPTLAEHVVIRDPSCVGVGKDVYFGVGCYLHDKAQIEIGDMTHFGPYCVLYGPLLIGNGCCIGANTVIAARQQHPNCPLDEAFATYGQDIRLIVIEDNVWIGANVTVVPGITIHTGAIVGAGSVVTHDVPRNAVVAGVPARRIRWREDRELP